MSKSRYKNGCRYIPFHKGCIYRFANKNINKDLNVKYNYNSMKENI